MHCLLTYIKIGINIAGEPIAYKCRTVFISKQAAESDLSRWRKQGGKMWKFVDPSFDVLPQAELEHLPHWPHIEETRLDT